MTMTFFMAGSVGRESDTVRTNPTGAHHHRPRASR
jgi:hypothetical protein